MIATAVGAMWVNPLVADPAPKRWKEDELVASYKVLAANGELEGAVRAPALPKDAPQPIFIEALAWYAAGMPKTSGVLAPARLDDKITDEVDSYMRLVKAKVENGEPNDYPRTRTWKLIQKYTLLRDAMATPEHTSGYNYRAMGTPAGNADIWDREHTLRSAAEVAEKVCGPSYGRPVLVKYGNTNCTQCMLFEIIGSIQDLADNPAHRGKVDVYKVWWGYRPDDSFAGRIRDPQRLDDLVKAEGVGSSPYFVAYRNGRRYSCGDAFPDEDGSDKHLEACLSQKTADAPMASFCQTTGGVSGGPVAAAAVQQPTPAPQPSPAPKLKIYGDVRLRAESDWDSLQSDGTKRADRDRLRARARLGFNYAYDDHIAFGARLRTGNPQDQQSPHLTLGDEFDAKAVSFDRVFIQGTWSRGFVWGGKSAFPFWTQNELFWDDDVAPEGIAGGLVLKPGQSKVRLKPTAAYFILEGSGSSNAFSDKSHVAAAQVAVEAPVRKVGLSGAAGFYSFSDNPATTDTVLADMDYAIWVAGARAVFNTPRPLSIGVDYMRNVEDYAPSLFNRNQKTGYVLQVSLGQLKQRKDWLVAYYYAHIEKFAVVARLAQDDWLRWGSGTDTRSSNFAGHELRLAYAFGPSWNMVLRAYDVEGIEPESPTAVAVEDGKRVRLDFNIGF